MRICRRTTWVLVSCWLISPAVWGQAQTGSDRSVLPGLESIQAQGSEEGELQVSAQYRVPADGTAGQLSVTARLRWRLVHLFGDAEARRADGHDDPTGAVQRL